MYRIGRTTIKDFLCVTKQMNGQDGLIDELTDRIPLCDCLTGTILMWLEGFHPTTYSSFGRESLRGLSDPAIRIY